MPLTVACKHALKAITQIKQLDFANLVQEAAVLAKREISQTAKAAKQISPQVYTSTNKSLMIGVSQIACQGSILSSQIIAVNLVISLVPSVLTLQLYAKLAETFQE